MKSFNSFEDLLDKFPKISFFIPNHKDYWAHTPKLKDRIVELLDEHIERVNRYALKLIHVHSIDTIVDGLISDIISNQPEFDHIEEIGNYIKLLFIKSIVFHDYGKINPNFQFAKMSNPLFKWNNTIAIDSQHSKLSAYLFIYYHITETLSKANLNSTERKFLWALIFLFSNPILKHHSSYLENQPKSFEQNILKSLKQFLIYFKIDTDINKLFEDKQYEQLFTSFYNSFKYENYFPLFVILKLNFSLLTASDYYATNAYSNEFEVNDFGLIDDDLKRKMNYHFWETEKFSDGKDNYNNDLFKNFNFYKNLSFDELNIKSSKNLNLLRQKLTAEVITNIQKAYNNRLFYLEAPTGAGKTNLSLAVAVELLKSNPQLNKIFYVFPFTTLITQTFSSIKNTLDLSNGEIIQLHSKSGFHEKDYTDERDAIYGNDKLNFIDNLFFNYPVTLLSHIRFFDILKSNSKEVNYILHRLSNSIIIIDELQSYNPKHWDKIIFYLSGYAKYLNLKVILMSATLPKLDNLDKKLQGNIISLIENKDDYFLNANFRGRVAFNFNLLQWKKPKSKEDKENYLLRLKDFLYEKAEKYAKQHNGKVYIIIEFIKKKTAGEFIQLVNEDEGFSSYTKFLISGEILEPRRKQIIDSIKKKEFNKVLLVSTQVVEAGVDIDMDIGFKDKSLVDSDEQLAGRVNRNAGKLNCVVYIFDYDSESIVYGKDERYKITKEQISETSYRDILETKNFDKFYSLVNEKINNRNENPYYLETLPEYLTHFKNFNFTKLDKAFQLIEEANTSVFVPLLIPVECFAEEDLNTMRYFNISPNIERKISGEDVWQKYAAITSGKGEEYIQNQVELKKIGGLISKFMFSIYKNFKDELYKTTYIDREISDKFGIVYLRYWYENDFYSLEDGFDNSKLHSDYLI